MRKYNSTINHVFSVQLRLACHEFFSKLLNCFLQLVFFGNQRLPLLLFQDHKSFHVEEQKRTQQRVKFAFGGWRTFWLFFEIFRRKIWWIFVQDLDQCLVHELL